MSILITGAQGFVGTELRKNLESQKIKYIATDINGISTECSKLDVRKQEDFLPFEKSGVETIVHLAANQMGGKMPKSTSKQQLYFNETNCLGTRNVAHFAAQNKIHNIIFISTDMVYGNSKFKTVINEKTQPNPLGPYGHSKLKCEKLLREWATGKAENNCTILRPRFIIGNDRRGILEKLFWLIEKGYPVPVIGDGSNIYQMISVNELAQIIIKLCSKTPIGYEIFNVGSNSTNTVKKMLIKTIEANDSRSKVFTTNANVTKLLLSLLEKLRIPIMYREQYSIADTTCRLDTSKIEQVLDISFGSDDTNLMIKAYESYIDEKNSYL